MKKFIYYLAKLGIYLGIILSVSTVCFVLVNALLTFPTNMKIMYLGAVGIIIWFFWSINYLSKNHE